MAPASQDARAGPQVRRSPAGRARNGEDADRYTILEHLALDRAAAAANLTEYAHALAALGD